MRPALLSVVILAVLGHAARGAEPQQEALSKATRQFGQQLHQKIARSRQDVVFSPLSIHSILSAAYFGSRNETALEMNKTLYLESLPESSVHDAYQELLDRLKSIQEVKVSIVSALFTNSSTNIERDYEREVEKKYSTEMENFNQTEWPEKSINEWMSNKTDGLIKEILPRGSIDDNTVMILVNSIYLNGTWLEPFDKSKTDKQEFIRPDGGKTQVEMMNDTRLVLLKKDEENRVDIVELPLKGSQLALVIVLPREEQGISRLEDLIKDSDKLSKMLEELRPISTNVRIPKFKIASRFDLEKPLAEMGLVKATSRDEADFSGISKDGGLHINKVVHQTVIEVDEYGTWTAAGSGLSAQSSRNSTEEVKERFIANHSFVFLVMDKSSKQILMQGKFSAETR